MLDLDDTRIDRMISRRAKKVLSFERLLVAGFRERTAASLSP
jgi:hypothetical protein